MRPPFVQGRFPNTGVYIIGAEKVEMTCQKLLPKIVVFFGNYFPFMCTGTRRFEAKYSGIARPPRFEAQNGAAWRFPKAGVLGMDGNGK